MTPTSGNGNGGGVWKWIAAMLASVMLAGAPGYVGLWRGPTQEEVNQIRDRQQQVLERLAAIDAETERAKSDHAELEGQIDQLRTEFQEHVRGR